MDEPELLLSPIAIGAVVVVIVVVGDGVRVTVPKGRAAAGGESGAGIRVRVFWGQGLILILLQLFLEAEAAFLEIEERRAAFLLPFGLCCRIVVAHFRTPPPPSLFLSPPPLSLSLSSLLVSLSSLPSLFLSLETGRFVLGNFFNLFSFSFSFFGCRWRLELLERQRT